MSKAPGHRKWPDHRVDERHITQRVQVRAETESIADSTDVVRVDEDKSPLRYYFPRADIRMEKLQRSSTTTESPFKGTAHYFNVEAGGRTLQDAAWSYEDPYEDHADLQGRIAFYDDKMPEITVTVA